VPRIAEVLGLFLFLNRRRDKVCNKVKTNPVSFHNKGPCARFPENAA
jgi:hypothetical protein